MKTVANPLSTKKMENILNELEVKTEQPVEAEQEEDLEAGGNDDEVSVLFYGGTCQCSKRSTCSTKSCSCRKEEQKCNVMCHGGEKSMCKNV